MVPCSAPIVEADSLAVVATRSIWEISDYMLGEAILGAPPDIIVRATTDAWSAAETRPQHASMESSGSKPKRAKKEV